MRVFISIDIPESIKKEIKKVQDSLPEFFGKRTALENLHLTLKFLGEINETNVRRVRENLRKIKQKSFETTIGNIGLFDNRKSTNFSKKSRKIIIWLHMTNCEALQRAVDENLSGMFNPEKRFMSHLTIARVKSLKNQEDFLNKLKKIKPLKVKFKVKSFHLKKSVLMKSGSKYETIETYTLK